MNHLQPMELLISLNEDRQTTGKLNDTDIAHILKCDHVSSFLSPSSLSEVDDIFVSLLPAHS